MRHTVTHILPYTPDQLFELVGDVPRYPEFVPWITAMRTWNARDEGGGLTSVDAEAAVGFSFLKEKFATRVRRDAGQRTVEVSLLYGPFKRLSNRWKFSPEGTGTKVDFVIDFEFKSVLLSALLASNMHHAIDRLIACFEVRADQLYGVPA